ncbi:MAG: glutathione S-transferase family protein [Betaproteobacteria bacterium]
MIDLYTANTSNGNRAAIILEECGLPYRVHKYDLMKGEHRTPEFLSVAPAGSIPVIVDPAGPGGKRITLAQSCAILLYVAEKAGKFIPQDAADRATAMQWLMQAGTDVSAASAAVFFNLALLPDKSEANGKFNQERVLRYFRDCERQLTGRDYLAGEISIADFALYPVYATRKPLIEAADSLPNVSAWGARIAARPGVQKGMQAAA